MSFLKGKYHGDFDLCDENGATTPSFSYKQFLNIKEKKSTEFLKGTIYDLGNENART